MGGLHDLLYLIAAVWLVEEQDDTCLELDARGVDVFEDLVGDEVRASSFGVGFAFSQEAADLLAAFEVLAAGDDVGIVGEARQGGVAR